MSVPSKQWLDALDNLQGAHKVTYPNGGSTSYPRIERTYNIPLTDLPNVPATLADYAGSTLVQLVELTRDNLRVKVYVRYETLPGPLITRRFYDSITGTPMHETRQLVAAGTSVPGLSVSGTTNLIVDAYYQPIDNTHGTMVVTYFDTMPASRVEAEPVGFQFPGQFTFIMGWAIPPYCTVSGPYPGVSYTLTPPRTASRPLITTISYTFTEPTLPDTWIVSSPGAASKFFPIGQNTIHNPILSEETCEGGAITVTIEDLPASTPSSYTPGDVLVVRAGYTPNWRGKIFEQRISTIAEPA